MNRQVVGGGLESAGLKDHDGSVTASRSGLEFLAGGGELCALIRAHDWAATPLGSPRDWPQSLKTAIRIMLTSRQPFWIGWGKDLLYFYNDPYKSIIGGRHPWALGQPTKVVWREIWHQIGPMLETAMGGIEGTYVEEQLLIMERNGYPEETYYTYSYSPIPDDDGTPGGIICANTDDTQRVINERQLALLRDLAAGTVDARTWQEACERSARMLGGNTRDLPFAMIYLAETAGGTLALAGACGIERGHPAAPDTITAGDATPWPVHEVLKTQEIRIVDDLALTVGAALPTGPWQQAPAQAALLPILASGETGRTGVLIAGLNPFRLFDDSYRGFLVLAAGQIASAVANAQAYEEERKRAEALAELDRAKTAFFSNVSHEFRTPLTLMLGPLEEMRREFGRSVSPLTISQYQHLDLMHRNGLRLLKLVNTLLDFSRIEAGRMEARYERTDLDSYTAELASVFRSAVEKAGLTLTIECPRLSEPAFVDREMWEKIVLNLISNAFKFTFAGEIAVRLRDTGTHFELAVRDTGTGIPQDQLPRIFERFHRVAGAQGRTHEGSGIGLALVQELARLHGGSVSAESVYGKGTTFRVFIPVGNSHLPHKQIVTARTRSQSGQIAMPFVEEAMRWLPEGASEDDGGIIRDVAVPERAEGRQDGRARIVLADDNADMRDYVRRLLSTRYDVEAVADGEAALAAAAREPPDLILSDVMMPRLDGFGLLQRLRENPATRTLPIILLSARAGEEARVEGVQAGADDYLTKPFSARELLARVATHLELARTRKDAARAVADSEARFRAVFEQAGTGVCLVDAPSGRLMLVNEALCQMLGYTAAELQAKTWQQITHPDDRDAELALSRKAISAELPSYTIEKRYLHKCGRLVWVRLFGAFIRSGEGDVLYGLGVAADITERKRAEEALRESEQQLSAIFAQAGAGLARTDLTGRFIQVNDKYCEIAGRTREELLGLRMQDIAHIEDLTRSVPLFQRAVERGESFTIEKRYVRPDRSVIWVNNSVSALTDAEGRVEGALAVSVDISERKRAEERDRSQKRILEMVASGAPLDETLDQIVLFIEGQEPGLRCGILIVADDGTHLRRGSGPHLPEAYHAALDGVPITPPYPGVCGEVAHRGVAIAIPDIAADPRWSDQWRNLVLSCGLKACRSTPIFGSDRRVLGSFAMYYDRTGDPNPVDTQLVDMATQLAAIALERDRAERELHESEARFRQMADHAPVMIWVTEPDASCTYLSKSWYEFTGQTPETGLGFGWLDATHPDDYASSRDIFMAANARSEAFRIEYRLRRRDGEYRWAIDTAAPRFGPSGEFLGYIGSVIDITERKQAEDRQRLLTNELNHRVKNTLAITQSIAAQTARFAPDPQSFNHAFSNRVAALARVHDILTKAAWGSAPLTELAAASLAPFNGADGRAVRIEGPAVRLSPGAAVSLSLALHELATNASKYGALTSPKGYATLGWETNGGASPVLDLNWAEHGGPPVVPPKRRGFGSRLIGALAQQLDAEIEHEYLPAGVRCRIRMPIDRHPDPA